MSAGFKVYGKVFWGTNGAVEAYVEAMAAEADTRFGPGDPMTIFFRDERDGFFGGKIVFLDEMLTDAASRDRFVQLLDASTEVLLRRNVFTEVGRSWVQTTVRDLRACLTAGPAGAG